MTSLLALDAGVTTGYAFASYGDEAPLDFTEVGVIENGIRGFLLWWEERLNGYPKDQIDCIIAEDFKIDGTIAPGDSLQIEGALMALWPGEIVWQSRSDKAALIRGEKARNAWIDERFPGLTTQHTRDAVTHALVRMKRLHHAPTIDRYWR